MPDTDPHAAAVHTANEQFYTALSSLSVDAMAAIWDQSDAAVCVHPGWEILSGWPEIRESWRVIFANTGFMQFKATDVQIKVYGAVATVTCVENIYTVVTGHSAVSRVACTNVFVHDGEAWKIRVHHGSPIATRHGDSAMPTEDGDN